VTEAPTDEPPHLNPDVPGARPDRPLTEVERVVLLEAEARRRAAVDPDMPPEDGGPRGPEPTRYGDWEKKGLAIDF